MENAATSIQSTDKCQHRRRKNWSLIINKSCLSEAMHVTPVAKNKDQMPLDYWRVSSDSLHWRSANMCNFPFNLLPIITISQWCPLTDIIWPDQSFNLQCDECRYIFFFVDNIWPTSQSKTSDLFAPEAVSPVAAPPPANPRSWLGFCSGYVCVLCSSWCGNKKGKLLTSLWPDSALDFPHSDRI